MKRWSGATGLALVLAVVLLAPSTAQGQALQLALVDGEPGSCRPSCRTGYYCHQGRCLSDCNPACPVGQRCVGGDCEPVPVAGEPTGRSYLAVLAGPRIGLNAPAVTEGELRVEIGGRYIAVELGPAFGKRQTTMRAAVVAFLAFQPIANVPLFLMPTLHAGYSYTWRDDPTNTRQHELLLTPGLRLRYELLPRLAILLEPLHIEVSYLRLEGDKTRGTHCTSDIPVHWAMQGGLALLY